MASFISAHKQQLIAVLLVLAACAFVGCASNATEQEGDAGSSDESIVTVDYTSEGSYKNNLSEFADSINGNLDAENAEANAPTSYVNRDGFTVQAVPSDEKGWNISYLDADNRGCTSCHALEDALMTLDTYHGTIFNGYATEQTYAQCATCHIWANSLKDTIHATHLSSDLFNDQNGSCESCHYINDDGGFEMWDYVKYSLYEGITDLTSDEVEMDVSYDQTTLTTTDEMFYKSIKEYGDFDASDWRTDDSYMDPELYDNWVFTVGGEVENELSMTLPELVEKFGTTTITAKGQCCINGAGNATIWQVEYTGVPVQAVLDYVGVEASVNSVSVLTEDPYPSVGTHYNVYYSNLNVEDAIIVTEVNGETLPNSQGYPCTLFVPGASAATNYKVCQGFNLVTVDDEDANTGYYLGGFEYPYLDGAPADKPNSAVLNYPTGVVLEGVAGTEVELEGYADAFDEPMEKIEFSWDGGETWTELDTPDNDSRRWTYWRMSFTPPEEGAYLLTIRTTSLQPDGTERVCAMNTEFMLNVK